MAAYASVAGTQADQSESKLLGLPAEIRNTIYEYALGGHTIHISRQIVTSKPKVSICRLGPQGTIADDGNLDEGRCRLLNEFEFQAIHHAISNSKLSLPLSLLLTCRQVHQEASLVPFDANDFILDDLQDLHITSDFTARLTSAQLAAIPELTLWLREPHRLTPWALRWQPLLRFSSLKKLSLLFDGLCNEESFELISERLSGFSGVLPTLKEIDVVVNVSLWVGNEDDEDEDGRLNMMAISLRQALLGEEVFGKK